MYDTKFLNINARCLFRKDNLLYAICNKKIIIFNLDDKLKIIGEIDRLVHFKPDEFIIDEKGYICVLIGSTVYFEFGSSTYFNAGLLRTKIAVREETIKLIDIDTLKCEYLYYKNNFKVVSLDIIYIDGNYYEFKRKENH